MLDHLDDLEADFLVFYGMEPLDILSISGPRFFALAYRVGAYDGALAARMAADEAPARSRGSSTQNADRTVEGSRAAIESDSALSGLIDFN